MRETRGNAQQRPKSGGIAVKGSELRRQMRLRGLTGAELARLTELSEGTISNALAGRSLHPSTFRKIAAELAKIEVLPGAELLTATAAVDGAA